MAAETRKATLIVMGAYAHSRKREMFLDGVTRHLLAHAPVPLKTIAYDLAISLRTVEIHRARVMDKMNARSLSELICLALAAGLQPK